MEFCLLKKSKYFLLDGFDKLYINFTSKNYKIKSMCLKMYNIQLFQYNCLKSKTYK